MTRSKTTRLLAATALILGMTMPFLASAADLKAYLDCLRHCAGSCNLSGHCFMIEK
ncbi:hypothetical protein [Lysobacter brunescens]|uniref:Uncharacterized protein n=1 Tax=Lysobacter brunescens TaxID=262323 RepID=A0ABW2YBW2_9GAMM